MKFANFINETLRPKKTETSLVLDLFAGCGGLSLGFEAQGFETVGYEIDALCCETYNANLNGKCINEKLTIDTPLPKAQIIIGGPPCQPFSVIGKQNGIKDSRDGFPIFISAVERLDPDIFIFENVKGLLYRSKEYFETILKALKEQGYVIEFQLLNAVNFGVPQNRERLIVVGHKGNFTFPNKNNNKVTAGEALGELATSVPNESKFLTKSMDEYVARYEKASKCVTPRDLHLHNPARTLTCRNLAGATSDMQRVRLPDGRRRRLLIQEAARLQTFPDWFDFKGSETNVFNQIGNAVSPLFAYHLAASVKDYINSSNRLKPGEIVYKNLPPQLELNFVSESKHCNHGEIVTLKNKSKKTKKLINDSLYILSHLGIPFEGLTERRLEKMAMAFLAVCDISKSNQWTTISSKKSIRALTTRQIIDYNNKCFEENISSGSYDDIRRKDLKLLTAAGVVCKSANNPDAATNNPTRGYALNVEYVDVIAAFGSENWEEDVEDFLSSKETLEERLSDTRNMSLLPVKLPTGMILQFSPGKHNVLQKAIIEDFLPRYGAKAEVLYVGDAANKFLHLNESKLKALNFFKLLHDELPDILAYSKSKNWLYLIEAVHSSGPISKIRYEELRTLTKGCKADIIYVSAFLDRATFRKFAPEIAWETEVWIADAPDHLIHFNGDKFLGPYAENREK